MDDDAESAEQAGSALLWDLDNVAPGLSNLPGLAAGLSRLVGPGAVRVAAGHGRLTRACRTTLEDAGIRVLSGGRRANGADRVLLAEAERGSRSGVGRFVVASNDRAFARIAALGHLYVVTLDARWVSARLSEVASGVFVIARDGSSASVLVAPARRPHPASTRHAVRRQARVSRSSPTWRCGT